MKKTGILMLVILMLVRPEGLFGSVNFKFILRFLRGKEGAGGIHRQRRGIRIRDSRRKDRP